MAKLEELFDIGSPIILEDLPKDEASKSKRPSKAIDSTKEFPNLILKVSVRSCRISRRAA